MIRCTILSALLITAASPALAWSQPELDKAMATFARETKEYRDCVVSLRDHEESKDSRIVEDVTAKDINGDGKDELIVSQSATQMTTMCFGMVGHATYLMINKDDGTWSVDFGYDVHALEMIPRPGSSWPDIELGGRGFCFPIMRMQNGEYNIWKKCDEGKLVLAHPGKERSVSRQVISSITEASLRSDHVYGEPFEHNGSLMTVDFHAGIIVYAQPKASIRKAVKSQTVLFEGSMASPHLVSGTAYTFKQGCKPAPYKVRGRFLGGEFASTLVLKGKAPVRSKNSCAVTGYSASSGNAKLVFEYMTPPEL